MPVEAAVTVTRRIQISPAEVCRGFTHEVLLYDWLSQAASTEPRRGGHLFLSWFNGRLVSGRYEEFEPPQALQFSWMDSELPAPTMVQVTCEEEGEGTRLTLKHFARSEGADLGGAAEGLRAFWEEGLENLASVLETGIDLRMARRPRLGIFFDELTPETAEKLGVPVKQGVLLEGVAEGTGAQAAGLEKGDVLVSLNGVPLEGFHSFEPALVGLRAGDRPLVEFYRGSEKHSVPLELSRFPAPEIPARAENLARRVKELDDQVLEAMRTQLAGLSDEQASRRPAEGEWSAKELVAHFILMERDFQGWAADMLNDTPVYDSLRMRPNVQLRLDALIARLGSLEALLDELALAKAESEALIAALPEGFVRNRKHLLRRITQWETEYVSEHYFEEHREQFEAVASIAEQASV